MQHYHPINQIIMKLKTLIFCLFLSSVSFAQTHTETKRNPDGTVTCMEYMTCFSCNGRSICNSCNGQGGKTFGYGQYARYTQCFSCNGRGTCGVCYGTGKRLIGRYITISKSDETANLVKLHNGYTEIHNNGKNTTKISYTQCGWCNGLNTCKTCNGSGLRNISSYSNPRYETCHSCYGEGTCNLCDNNGMVKKVFTFNNDSGQTFLVNETTGNIIEGNIYDSQGSSSSSSNSGTFKTSCRSCDGTGRVCETRVLYSGADTWCDIFQKTIKQAAHFHKECPVCKGVGSY